jgi:hypothetical protein
MLVLNEDSVRAAFVGIESPTLGIASVGDRLLDAIEDSEDGCLLIDIEEAKQIALRILELQAIVTQTALIAEPAIDPQTGGLLE